MGLLAFASRHAAAFDELGGQGVKQIRLSDALEWSGSGGGAAGGGEGSREAEYGGSDGDRERTLLEFGGSAVSILGAECDLHHILDRSSVRDVRVLRIVHLLSRLSLYFALLSSPYPMNDRAVI
ncbi:hypothetical protein Acor_82310 [Acrocarpospora corrugata]|uniref:Uncharacterized protein n=1 Tax=Acrocarpospora corrugata TaxID=35763 RepID=A0A5M3WDK8_9ACTN|nr:hypothetical protein [Acrocarpospora corrugata]GES06162.1 hypothetical protein Acor_82310 [Acrocarpospora corrugata]